MESFRSFSKKKTKKMGRPKKGLPIWKCYMTCCVTYTQPVGLGNPAILHAPLPGPLGNNS